MWASSNNGCRPPPGSRSAAALLTDLPASPSPPRGFLEEFLEVRAISPLLSVALPRRLQLWVALPRAVLRWV